MKSLTEDCRGFPVEVIVANDGADVGIRAATRYGARVIDIPVSAGSYAARNGGLACGRRQPPFPRRERASCQAGTVDAYDYVAGSVQLAAPNVRSLALTLDFLREFRSEIYFADG